MTVEPEGLKKIKFLTYARGFYYTPVCVDDRFLKYPRFDNFFPAELKLPLF